MREQQRMIEAELSNWTGFEWEYQQGGKHKKVVVKVGERRGICPFSETPVSRRAMLNNITHLRRTLNEVGAVRRGK